ncbi:hypothetical protein ACHWQZ_G015572 [Mnemiopsis leidyi]
MPGVGGNQEAETSNPQPMEVGAPQSQQQQLNTDNDFTFFKKFKQYVSIITENERDLPLHIVNCPDEGSKFKAAQELSEHLEFIVQNSYYKEFLIYLLDEFLKFIEAGEPIYQENSKAQIRKLVLEIIHRLPRNSDLEPHARKIQSIMFRLVERENEDCAQVCMRTIHEIHKTFKPTNPQDAQEAANEIRKFLQFVIGSFTNLPLTMKAVLINDTHTGQSGSQREPRNIPKATQSLKVLSDLPLQVVIFYQAYQTKIEEDVSKLIHIMINSTLTLHPEIAIKNSDNFVQEAFVDFITVQIKTISFLAFMIKHRPYHEIIENDSVNFIKGLIACFKFCPAEAPHLRREVIVACRHLVSANQPETQSFRYRMVSFMDDLLDESVLIGTGWTNKEGSRSLAYSTLADLIHQVRDKLSLKQLAGIVNLFSKNVHDSDLTPSMQNMACKILINIVDFINKKSEKETAYTGRELMMRMLEVFVQKFQMIAKHQLPKLFARCAKQVGTEIPTSFPPEAEALNEAAMSSSSSKKGQSSLAVAVADCRVLVKTLVCGVKTITWTVGSYKHPPTQNQQKFQPGETYLFIRLLKFGLKCLNIYRIQVGPPPNRVTYVRAAINSQIRSKEEKDIVEHFASVFVYSSRNTFREVFETNMDYLIDSIQENHSLTMIPHYFMVSRDMMHNSPCSAIFACQLAKYLVNKLEDMGLGESDTNDRPVLYTRLFKLLFGSVQNQGGDRDDVEADGILKPHLQRIVNQSMVLAQTAKDPAPYFTLLRLLFRAIGSTSTKYDEMYSEFLPLLPSLLQSLNRLQSGVHKQQMKDIFIELCLTVPVRLSNLLPYLPALMDPLVSALNGSNTLIAQGLRTLELCIDNLQPNFFYDKIEPVRAELIQSLWQTLQNSSENDNNAKTAFRVLGKCGARNRKTLQDAPKLEYVHPDATDASVLVWFPNCHYPVKLPIQKVLDHALHILKSPNKDLFYMQHSLHVCQSYIISMINLSDTTLQIQKLLATISRKQSQASHPQVTSKNSFVCSDEPTRTAFKTALMGLFVATATKQLRTDTTQFMMSVVRHFSLLTVVQQSGVFPIKKKSTNSLDVHVLVDVIAECMGSEQSELANIGEKAIRLVTETCKYILGSAERAFQIPFFDVLVDKLCGLCYERAWYTKVGGVTAIEWLINNAPLLWTIRNQQLFINATIYIMIDLHEEVSYGTMGRAQSLYEKIMRHCNTPSPVPAISAAQEKVSHSVLHLLVKDIMSPYPVVRKQARQALVVLSEVTGKTVKEMLEPLPKDLITETVWPKKQTMFTLPETKQLACMESIVFCSSLEPRLITLDVTGTAEGQGRKKQLEEILMICGLSQQELLNKYSCYKKSSNITLLKKTALKVLSYCHYLTQHEPEIFKVMYDILTGTDKELQLCAKDAIQLYQRNKREDIVLDTVHKEIRPLLTQLTDWKHLTVHLLEVLTHLMELFSTLFNDKLCDQLLKHLKKWMDNYIFSANPHQLSIKRTPNGFSEEILRCKAIINTFHLVPPPSRNFFSTLISLVVRAEKYLNVEVGSPFQEGLFKYVLKHPGDAIDLFLKELHEPSMNRMFYNFLKHKDGGPLRDHLCGMPMNLLSAISQQTHDGDFSTISDISMRYQEVLFQGTLIISLLVKHDMGFLSKNLEIVNHLRAVWNQPQFQERFKNPDKLQIPTHQWLEPKLLAKCLLRYLQCTPNDFELLFQLLRIYDAIYVPNIKFLQDHIQNNVIEGFTIEQRRSCFFKFVEIFQVPHVQGRQPRWTQELKGKILQYIIVPMFQYSFEKNDTEKLIEGVPGPDGNPNPAENIINVFMDPENRIIVDERDILDVVRIHLLKLSAEFVRHAAEYIHPTNSTRRQEGDKLRKLMKYAWPSMLPKSSQDPTTKYYGHLVLSLIISKFPIMKKIVIQVFHSLLKAHNLECRNVVFQALEIITPAMPRRMDDGKAMLYHWTKKIIVEDGHTVSQLVHLLNLIVKQYRVYYLWRQYLIQHMLTAMQKFAFTQAVTIEHQKLACDLAEVVIKWEIQRVHEANGVGLTDQQLENIIAMKTGLLINQSEVEVSPYRPPSQVSLNPCPLRPPPPEPLSPFETRYGDGVFNFLLRLSYSAYTRDSNTNIQQSEALSKRCIQLVKLGMKPELDIFKNCSAKIWTWADRELQRIKTPPDRANPAYFLQGICTILQLVEFLLDIIQREVILKNICHMTRGLSFCMQSPNLQITKTVHSLLAKMFTMFPIDQRVNHEEVSNLYESVNEIISHGLDRYDKGAERYENKEASPVGAADILYSPLMILKAACATSPRYLERFVKEYIKCLQKLQKEHCSSSRDNAQRGNPRDRPVANVSTSDLIMVCIDLVKDQVELLGNDINRKMFFGNLITLIEKSPDPKLLRSLTDVVAHWVQSPKSGVTLKEKTLLLTKMNQNYENHFPNDTELMASFLKIILHVYTDSVLQAELGSKLESAFMTGLRFTDPKLRCKFTEVLKQNVSADMFERLAALISPHNFNWKLIGPHFWVKQFIEMLLTVNDGSKSLKVSNLELMLPSLMISAMPDPTNSSTSSVEMFTTTLDNPGPAAMEISEGPLTSPTPSNLQVLAEKHGTFLESLKDHKSSEFVQSVCQLAHDSTTLANHLWVKMFAELWNTFSKDQQSRLCRDLPQFLCASMLHDQGDLQPSSVGCFLESLRDVPVPLKPCYLKYLGSVHNCWHQVALRLEEMGTDGETFASFQLHQKQVMGEYPKTETQDRVAYDAIDCLTVLYSQLNEHDMWTGLWFRRCKHPETIKALGYQNLGFYELAQSTYESATKLATAQLKNACATTNQQPEFKLWKDQWMECTRQCSQWNILNEIAKVKGSQHPSLLLESSWRIGDWTTMKDVLSQADRIMPDGASHLVSLYKGYLALQQEEDPGPEGPVESHWKQATINALRQWRKLPRIVGNVHVPLLQFAQQATELHESQSIQKNLLPNRASISNSKIDIKATLKAWRNRPPVISDDIGHWNDIFSWRQHYHQKIIDVYTTLDAQPGIDLNADPNAPNLLLIGQQSSATTMVTYASLARKHGLSASAQEWLARVHTIPSVPLADCHKKLKEQIKVHLLPPASQQDLLAGLDVIEGVNMRILSKPEHKADILAHKAHIFAMLGRSDDSMKTFSQAIQTNDQVPGAWALWATYCDELFQNEVDKASQEKISLMDRVNVYKANLYQAESAIACYLQACSKQKDDSKVRRYISRILWLLTFDTVDEVLSKCLEQFHTSVHIEKWLEWVPQLLAGLGSKEARVFHAILQTIGRVHPQALYFPIRNVYLTVRGEYQEVMARHKSLMEYNRNLPDGDPMKKEIPDQPPEFARLKPRMSWCNKLLHVLREIHPTMLNALESIIETLHYMKDAWYDEVLQKLYTVIQMCETEAFEIDHRQDVLNVKISQQIYKYITSIIQYLNTIPANSRSRDASKQTTIKQRFEADFDFSNNQGKRLHKVLKTLKCWVKMLDKTQSNSSKNYMEERCSYLSKFCSSSAEVYLIGEFLNPKAHYVKIARFLPKIETIRKHSLTARRLFIRGSNGKVYPYLMVNTSSHIKQARSEERFLQLLRMFNKSLVQRKESCRRNLQWSVPKVVATAPSSRLIEDNTSNISVLEIYRWYCKNRTPEMEVDAPIAYYYEQLGRMQNEGSVLNRIALNKIYHYIQTNILPPTVLLDWAKKTYPDPVMFWSFRHQITRQTALDCLVQFALFLSSLKPEHIYITQETGTLSTVHYHIPISKDTGEFVHEQHIPFRLTPNMITLMGPISLSGPMVFSMIAAARCLIDPKLGTDAILHAILKDEVQASIKDMTEPRVISMIEDIQSAVNQIMSRLQTAANFEKAESKLPSIISLTTTPENLCRLDPAWYPWL